MDADDTLHDDAPPSAQLLPRVEPIRRTQSLYTNHPDLFRGNGHLAQSTICTFKVSQDLIPRIDETEMARILLGQRADQFDEYVVVDCRFPYEYDGGHIGAALNVPLQTELENVFVANAARFPRSRTRLLIFHCEYSVFRGPTMASHLRKLDRIYNADRYPELLYPDIVVLDGGYKRFFDAHKHHCVPQAYVEMRDINHRSSCELLMNKVRQLSKLTRAKLFNQFQPRVLQPHMRSLSYTLVSLDPLATSPVALRRKCLGKIQKRDRRDRLLLVRAESPRRDPHPFFDADWAPPPALFGSHSKGLSLLLASVSSLLLLLGSDFYSSAFLSTDSLHDSLATPTAEAFDLSDLSSPTKSCNSPTKAKPRLSRINTRPSNAHYLALSSPTVSSPLTYAAISTPTGPYQASVPSSQSTIDSINDSPFELSLGIKPHHRNKSRAFSSMSGNLPFVSLDINEVEEESD